MHLFVDRDFFSILLNIAAPERHSRTARDGTQGPDTGRIRGGQAGPGSGTQIIFGLKILKV